VDLRRRRLHLGGPAHPAGRGDPLIDDPHAQAKGQCECTGQCGAHQPRDLKICRCGHGSHWHTLGLHDCIVCGTEKGKACGRFELACVEKKVWRCQDGTRRIDKRTGLRVALEPLRLTDGTTIMACPSCRSRYARGYVAPQPPEKADAAQSDLFQQEAARGTPGER
jgi:hypothetical protein